MGILIADILKLYKSMSKQDMKIELLLDFF